MKIELYRILFIRCVWLLLVSYTYSCSAKRITYNNTLTVDQNAQMIRSDGKSIEIKKQEKIFLPKEPVWIESKGYNGTILYPMQNNNMDLKLSLRPSTAWVGDSFYAASNQTVSEVLSASVQAIQLMSTGNINAAIAGIDKTLSKYPYISYLNFLRASALTMLNRKQEALISLEKALRDFPEDVDGNKLYETLTGRKFKS